MKKNLIYLKKLFKWKRAGDLTQTKLSVYCVHFTFPLNVWQKAGRLPRLTLSIINYCWENKEGPNVIVDPFQRRTEDVVSCLIDASE